ncbi:Peroxidase 12 [Ancistrocladus abbreviatus]
METMRSVASMSMSMWTILLMLTMAICLSAVAAADPPIVDGLSWSFYESSCPKLESIIRKHLKKVFHKDITLAPGLLRLHFHDCFVQGCEGSVLLDGTASRPSEKQAPPNLSLRPEAFQIVNDLRALVQDKCGQIVSCADITALAARDAVYLSGGPEYDIPLGRRDGLTFATQAVTLANLPPPFSNTTTILSQLATKNLNPTDVVALSGAHTIGRSHCFGVLPRLFPTQDPTMDKTLANNLKKLCPNSNSTSIIVMDLRSPNKFDNKYYIDLMNRQGLFTSDQDLYMDKRTKGIVTSFALDQALFFEKFVLAMIKMGQLSVLTGTQGEIRANCSAINSGSGFMGLSSVVGGAQEQEKLAY